MASANPLALAPGCGRAAQLQSGGHGLSGFVGSPFHRFIHCGGTLSTTHSPRLAVALASDQPPPTTCAHHESVHDTRRSGTQTLESGPAPGGSGAGLNITYIRYPSLAMSCVSFASGAESGRSTTE